MLGVNYYSTVTVKMWDGVSPRANADGHKDVGGSPWPGSGDVEFVVQPGPYTEMGWNIAPDGLEELLVSLHEQFPRADPHGHRERGGVPRRVVETDDGKRVPDADRTDYLNRHFTAAHRAIARGVDLQGYFVWSLLDNFEWGWGYTKRFGIVRVDYETQERIVKDSARWLQKLIATRRTPAGSSSASAYRDPARRHSGGRAVLSRTTRLVARSIRGTDSSGRLLHPDDQAGRLLRHPHQRLPDRREPRAHPLRERDVVVTDHGQVVRDMHAERAHRIQDPERLQVAAREDRGRAVGSARAARDRAADRPRCGSRRTGSSRGGS